MENINKKIRKYFLPIFFVPILVGSPVAFPVELPKNEIKILEINYDNAKTFLLQQGESEELTSETLSPREKSDPYFLIRAGITVSSTRDLRSGVTFFGPISDKAKICNGENLYDPSFIIGSNYNSTIEKKKFFNTCFKFKVQDLKQGKVEFEQTQANCTLEKLNDYTVLISPGDCFFKVVPGQQLNVELQPNSSCHDKSFLSQNNFSPSEMQAQWNAYIYPTKEMGVIFTPSGPPLFEKTLFIDINPGDELLKVVTKEVGEQTIYRPGIFVLPDYMLSDFTATNLKEIKGSYVNFKFLISTHGGKDFCNSGLCSNYGNYDVPFVPFFVLYEIDSRSGKKMELKSFFMGDRIPGKWNGVFSQKVNLSGIVFEEGKKYLIELSFSDPIYSYEELKKTFKNLLGLGKVSIGSIGGGTTIGTLSTFGTIGTLGEIGTLRGLNTGSFFDGIEGIEEGQIPRIVQSIKDPSFPPEYTTVCNKDLTKCQNSRTSDFEKLNITFEVKSIGTNRQLNFGDSIKVQRMAGLLPEFNGLLDFNKKPKLDCGGL